MLRIFIFFLCVLSLTSTTAQKAFHVADHLVVNPLLIQHFQGSRCLETQTWQPATTSENKARIALGDLYDADTKYPFMLFFSKTNSWYQRKPLYLVAKGHFSTTHISLPLDWPGYYYLTILDQQKPSLITINTTTFPVTIEYRKACALDLYPSF